MIPGSRYHSVNQYFEPMFALRGKVRVIVGSL